MSASSAPLPSVSPSPTPLVLEIQDLHTSFFTEEGEIRAVNGVNVTVRQGQTVAIVGESGCGKSVTAYSVLRLINRPGRITNGRVLLHGEGKTVDVLALDEKSPELFAIRGAQVAMIFQEALAALSPVHTVGAQIVEAIQLHQAVTPAQAKDQAIAVLRQVGIRAPEVTFDQFPHQVSGGMRQRVVIAMAVVCRPRVLIADEPTTALDATIQTQVLDLLKQLQQELGTAIVLITHDLGVVAHAAHHVVVMYLGRVVENAPVEVALQSPRHPYTAGLLASLPSRAKPGARLPSIHGAVPPLTQVPAGCPFHPRCPHARVGVCDTGAPPPLTHLSPPHSVACFLAQELSSRQLMTHASLGHTPPLAHEGDQ